MKTVERCVEPTVRESKNVYAGYLRCGVRSAKAEGEVGTPNDAKEYPTDGYSQ